MVGFVLFAGLFSATLLAAWWATPFFADFVGWIREMAGTAPATSFGVSVSVIGSLVVFVYTALTQNMRAKGVVRSYRRAEEELMNLNKMSPQEILDYHRSYNWHSYAGLGFSTLFIIVALFIEGRLGAGSGFDFAVIVFGLALVACAAVILGIVDLVHTNTLTPLVTVDKRFELINILIILGGLALSLKICAVGVFLALINSWLSVLTTAVMIILMISLTRMRGIPIQSLRYERDLTDHDVQRVMDTQA